MAVVWSLRLGGSNQMIIHSRLLILQAFGFSPTRLSIVPFELLTLYEVRAVVNQSALNSFIQSALRGTKLVKH